MSRLAWRTHPNASGPAATLLAIHDQFRAVSARLLLLDGAVVRRAWMPLAQTLHHHHHAEEAMLFPLIERRTGVAPAQLVTDHDALTEAIAAVEACLASRLDLAGALARFHDVLVAHLDREEALVIPVLLEMTPTEAWEQIHA